MGIRPTLAYPHSQPRTDRAQPSLAPAGAAEPEPFDVVYERMVGVLRFIAYARFRIPLAEAESLVQDVFLKYALDPMAVRSPRDWLIAAISNASRNYLRDHKNETTLPEDAAGRWEDPKSEKAADRILTKLAVGATLRRLGDSCREVLYRFHVDGESTAAIASELGTTAGYVQLRLHLCRKRARALYNALTKVPA